MSHDPDTASESTETTDYFAASLFRKNRWRKKKVRGYLRRKRQDKKWAGTKVKFYRYDLDGTYLGTAEITLGEGNEA